ncbi:MAG: SDR family NAD(P)-dependent oxidoreductase [Actinomycetota bacterium]|jgi:NAD(P)-dependent dehydrogenase (short-subunit alcohol dehydrogenase family)|nr:SDR family NAD(P)-dependent oxidoreductase [Actinomycetota bacterium]
MPAAETVVVVTGSARGLGRTTAEKMAAPGVRLVLVDVADQSATAAAVRALGAEAEAVQADVSSEEQVVALARELATAYGAPDVLVNNAGISLLCRAEKISLAQWEQVLGVNLTGPFLCCRELGALMLARGAGSIVNVASVAGLRAITDRAAYNASKHGLIGLTVTLAAEWGGRGVRVNAVCPGWIKTEMDEEDQASGAYQDEDIQNQVPMARFAAPGDVAEAIAFLADPSKSGFVNGVALPIDGGWVADGSWTSLRLSARSR